jgi:hypothetical protein
VGSLNVRGSLEGSHLAPTTRAQWLAPSSGVAGSATLGPTRLSGELTGPAFSLRATADTSAPHAELARGADTQAAAMHWGQPRVEGVEIDAALAGVDVAGLVAQPPPAPTVAQAEGAQAGPPGAASAGGVLSSVQQQLQQQLSGKGAGGAAGSGAAGQLLLPAGRADALQQQLAAAPGSAAGGAAGPTGTSGSGGAMLGGGGGGPGAVKLRLSGRLRLSAKRDDSEAARRQQLGATGEAGGPYVFTGPITLEGLRVNSLSLARFLAGDVTLTEPRLLLRARGGRADELIELDLALPAPADIGGPAADGSVPAPLFWPEGFGPPAALGAGGGRGGPPLMAPGWESDARRGAAATRAGGGGVGGSDEGYSYGSGHGGREDGDGRRGRDEEAEQRVSHVLLRRGGLYLSSTVGSGQGLAAAGAAAVLHFVCTCSQGDAERIDLKRPLSIRAHPAAPPLLRMRPHCRSTSAAARWRSRWRASRWTSWSSAPSAAASPRRRSTSTWARARAARRSASPHHASAACVARRQAPPRAGNVMSCCWSAPR